MPEVTADEMLTMYPEIVLGVKPEDSRLPMTDERRTVWRRLEREVAEIKRRGGLIEVLE